MRTPVALSSVPSLSVTPRSVTPSSVARPHDAIAIGDLARRTGVHIETIRYYEREGLLPLPARSPSGQRRYTDADVRRLRFLKRCRDLGFSLGEARTLAGLAVATDTTCADVKAVVSKHLRAVRARLVDLQELEQTLAAMETVCPGSESPDCPILDALSRDGPDVPT